jgi:hypothetical protein
MCGGVLAISCLTSYFQIEGDASMKREFGTWPERD